MRLESLALWLLATLVFSIPFENGVTIPGVGSVSRILGLAAFAVGATALFRDGRLGLRAPSVFLVLALLLVLWSMATVTWSIAPSTTLGTSVTLAQLFALAWLVWEFCRAERQLDLLSTAFVLGCYVTIAVALVTFFTTAGSDFRNVGNFNPNEFSIVAALGIPLAWRMSLRARTRAAAWLHMLYPAFAIMAVILAASRGGLLTALVALAVIPLSLSRLTLLRRLLLFTVIAVTVWAGFVWAPQAYPDLARNIERLSAASDELTGGTLTGRTEIWRAGGRVFLSSPLVGVGFGTFPQAVEPILNRARAPHNAFLSVAAGGGLIGLVIYLAVVGTAFISVIASEPGIRPFLLVLFVALLVGMTPTNSDTDKFSWFLLSLLAGQRPLVLSVAASRRRAAAAGSTEGGGGFA